MTTVFPGALDTFSNPAAGDALNNVTTPHASQHANLNDAMRAAEVKLGVGATSPDAQFKTLYASAAGVSNWAYAHPVKLGEVSGNGSSAILEVTSIPATFRSLDVILTGRSTKAAATNDTVTVTFESSPTAGIYHYEHLYGVGTTPIAAEVLGTSGIVLGLVPAASSTSFAISAFRLLIPEYANSGVLKTFIGQTAEILTSGTGNIVARMINGWFAGSIAIARVRMTLTGGNWTTDSRMSIYGIPS